MKSISVIIPNYNGKNLLEQNLPFVFRALNSSHIEDFEVIVTDDASNDDSVDFLKKNYLNTIILLENPVNLGFSGNVNRGIRIAKKDLIFILNSDVQLTEGFFIPLMKYFEFPDTFGVMSRIDNFQNQTIDQAKFPKISFSKMDGTQNYFNPQLQFHYSFFLSGANALIDRKKILELGGFLEIFNPFYYEDVDLGIRAWRKGYKCYYDNTAVCFHEVSNTIKKKPKKQVQKIILRNKIYLHYLHLSKLGFVIFLLKFLGKMMGKLLILNTIYWSAFQEFIKKLKVIHETKKKINSSSKFNLMKIKTLILNQND